MTMTAPLRKLTLTAHVTASVGWLGALAVFFAHALASLTAIPLRSIAPVSFGVAAPLSLL